MYKILIFSVLVGNLCLISCKNASTNVNNSDNNAAFKVQQKGGEEVGKDPEFISQDSAIMGSQDLAPKETDMISKHRISQLLEASGGQKAWDSKRYVDVTIEGRNRTIYDKQTGNCRIEFDQAGNSVVVFNALKMNNFKVKLNGKVLEPGSPEFIGISEQIKIRFANVMIPLSLPYVLQSPNAKTRFFKKSKKDEDILEAFVVLPNVPDQGRKFVLVLDPLTHLVNEYTLFADYEGKNFAFSGRWRDYRKVDGLNIAFDKMGGMKISDLQFPAAVPEGKFLDF